MGGVPAAEATYIRVPALQRPITLLLVHFCSHVQDVQLRSAHHAEREQEEVTKTRVIPSCFRFVELSCYIVSKIPNVKYHRLTV